jgi:DNA-binding response OmpR family regulator
MKALVIENDLMSQCVLAKLLGERGHSVMCFENAEQAVLAYQKEFYPLVFVSVALPGMDGLQFCRWLRSQPTGARTYVIAAASPGQPADLSLVLAAGASDFLLKPYDVGTLKVRLAVGERHVTSFFRELEMEEQLERRNQEWNGVQSELRRVAEHLARENETRIRAEEQLETVRKELMETRDAFDSRLKDQAAALCASASDLESATSFRLRVEDDLKKVQSELEAVAQRYEVDRAEFEAQLAAEKEANRNLTDESLKIRESLLARVEELTAAARRADDSRQQFEQESRRAADALARAQGEWDIRQREMEAQVERARREGEAAEAEKHLAAIRNSEEALMSAREEYARRFEAHTAGLMKLDEELQRSLAERRQLQAEVDRLQRELGERPRVTMAPELDLNGVREAVREAIGEMLSRNESVTETEMVRLREAYEDQFQRRQQAELALQQAKAQFQEQLRQVVSSLEPVGKADCLAVQ